MFRTEVIEKANREKRGEKPQRAPEE